MIQVPFLSTDFSLVIPFSAFTPIPGFWRRRLFERRCRDFRDRFDSVEALTL